MVHRPHDLSSDNEKSEGGLRRTETSDIPSEPTLLNEQQPLS